MHLIRYGIAFLIILLECYCFSQPKSLKFDRLTMAEGLPALSVTCILQDKQGFIWIATEGDGLFRFDGYNFKTFKASPDTGSISNNILLCLYEDSRGTLWAGTFDGLNKFVKETENFVTYRHNPYSNSLSDNVVHCIVEDKQGVLWIGTGGGLNRFDGENFTVYKNNPDDSNSLSNNDVRSIYEDSNQNLWIATLNGLNKFDKISKFTRFKKDKKDPNAIIDPRVTNVYGDRNSNIWITTGRGLYKVSENHSKFFPYLINPPKHIISICEDDSGFLWLGTPNGLVIFDPLTENVAEYKYEQINLHSIAGNYLPSIYKDKASSMWLGTGGGISYYNPNKTRFNRYFNDGVAWTINTDIYDNLYIGTTKNGLWVLDSNRSNQRKILYNEKPASTRAHNFAVSINSSIPDYLLIGFERDFYEYNIIKRTFTKYPGREGRFRIWDILTDSRGFIWLAPMTEIVILDFEMNEIAVIKDTDDSSSLSEGYVTVLHEDKNGVIWAGTSSGLNKIIVRRLANGSAPEFNITRYKNISNDSNSISGNNITCLYEDNNGTLWVGTQNGLNKLIQNFEKFKRYTETEGLPENSVQGILEDDSGNLWISTDKFLTKFNPYSETFTNYSTSDGLPNKFLTKSCHKSKKGEMFFGTENGVIAFYPEYIKENLHVPPLTITSFKIFNKEAVIPKSILLTEEIYLSYKENFFSFEFSALDYTNPLKNQYAYMLEGVDKSWVKTTALKREASYTDIAPGEYIFRVKGSNNDGVWNETGKSIKIIITPPWWLTLWAKGFYVLMVVGFLVFVRHRKLSKIRKEMQRQAEFTKQLIESQEQERKRIAGELHDSMGQNLMLIKNKAVLSLKDKKLNEKTLESFNEISELSSLTLSDVRAISYNLRPYELDRIGLTKTIESLIERAEKSTSIKFITSLDDIEDVFTPESDIIVYRIIQECINNIVKHSNANEVNVVIRKNVSNVTIIIKDDGKGFDTDGADSKGGFGLKGMSERVNLLKGKISIESKRGIGTTITITIPLKT